MYRRISWTGQGARQALGAASIASYIAARGGHIGCGRTGDGMRWLVRSITGGRDSRAGEEARMVGDHVGVTGPPRAVPTILQAGLLAGTLDITAALVIYARSGAQRIRLLQGIASGLLGKAAFGGGLTTALAGLLCHFVIAMSWAAIYFAVSRRVRFLVEHAFVSGTVYAVIIYFIMNHVVVPLSAIGPRPFVLSHAILAATILVFCIGLPIALVVRYFSVPRASLAPRKDSPDE
jgi:hypothetical protein